MKTATAKRCCRCWKKRNKKKKCSTTPPPKKPKAICPTNPNVAWAGFHACVPTSMPIDVYLLLRHLKLRDKQLRRIIAGSLCRPHQPLPIRRENRQHIRPFLIGHPRLLRSIILHDVQL